MLLSAIPRALWILPLAASFGCHRSHFPREFDAGVQDAGVQDVRVDASRLDAEPRRPLADPVVALDLGRYHACAARESGSVVCWGSGEDGELGFGEDIEMSAPARVPDLPPMRDVATDSGHTCAVGMDESIYCWGRNSYRVRASSPEPAPPSTATLLTSLPTGQDVQVGTRHSCVLQDGRVRCRGAALEGQFPPPPAGDTSGVSDVALPRRALALASHLKSICALLDDGSVACWGGHQRPGLLTYRREPVILAVDAVDVAVGRGVAQRHEECAALRDGSVVCWPRTFEGPIMSPSPSVVAGLDDIVEVDLGHNLGCARQGSGAVYCWGRNWGGQMGDGTYEEGAGRDRLRGPARVVGIDDAIAIGVGDAFACAALQTGRVLCWGDNRRGQHGDEGPENRAVPTEVPLP